jgi:hypothetical protein
MWSAIRWLVLRIAAIRWLFKLGGLAFLLPIAFLLKTIGLPLLGILSILALPILILLFLFGLPIFLVLVFGSMLMGLIGTVLTIGVAAIKIGLFVVLPIWVAWKVSGKLWRWMSKKGGGDSGPTGTTGTSTPPAGDSSPPPATGPISDPTDGMDPA